MSNPIVSVVIPTYRRPQALRACLESLASQKIGHEAFEVVVVDDGSPEPLDGALAAVEALGLNVRLFRQPNAGPAAARNRGAREAVGFLLAFTDDDCRPTPEWLERLIEAEQDFSGAMIGGSTDNGLRSDLYAITSQLINDLVYEHFNPDHEHATFLASNNILLSRERFLQIGGFDQDFAQAGGEDRDFCNRWRAAGWRLVWRLDARINHHHSQSLGRFLNMHFRYGQGAYRYQARRQAMGTGNVKDDMGFHRSLLGRLSRRLGRPPGYRRSLWIVGALVLWQLAYMAGYLQQAWLGRDST